MKTSVRHRFKDAIDRRMFSAGDGTYIFWNPGLTIRELSTLESFNGSKFRFEMHGHEELLDISAEPRTTEIHVPCCDAIFDAFPSLQRQILQRRHVDVGMASLQSFANFLCVHHMHFRTPVPELLHSTDRSKGKGVRCLETNCHGDHVVVGYFEGPGEFLVSSSESNDARDPFIGMAGERPLSGADTRVDLMFGLEARKAS